MSEDYELLAVNRMKKAERLAETTIKIADRIFTDKLTVDYIGVNYFNPTMVIEVNISCMDSHVVGNIPIYNLSGDSAEETIERYLNKMIRDLAYELFIKKQYR